jgi:hypothetical protein
MINLNSVDLQYTILTEYIEEHKKDLTYWPHILNLLQLWPEGYACQILLL